MVQSLPQISVYPQFLTGKSKSDIVDSHKVYSPMFDAFKSSFNEVDTVVIVGYSYGDIHINRIIKQGLDNNTFRTINVNPWKHFPFRKNYKNEKVELLDSLEQLDLK